MVNMRNSSRMHVGKLGSITFGVEVVVMVKLDALLLGGLVVRLDHLVKRAVVVLVGALGKFILRLARLHGHLHGLAASRADHAHALRPGEGRGLGPKSG